MNVLTFDYNRNYFPSAPFVTVEVNNYDFDSDSVTIEAQIDSGADATMMPFSVLEKVAARFESTQIARDFSGATHRVDLYSAAIKLAGQIFYLRVIAQENTQEGILGRDVLNHLVVTLKGPAAVTEIPIDSI